MEKVSTKLFRLDLSYFKKNFLNQKTWGQSHVIYENSTIKVTLSNTAINTRDKDLEFTVKVELLDQAYFVKAFGTEERDWTDSGLSTFSVPLDHEEYSEDVFARKVYGEFKYAIRSMAYYWSNTDIMKKLDALKSARYKLLKEKAVAEYNKSKATAMKKVISETVYCNEYIAKDKEYDDLQKLYRELDNNARYKVTEKDTKLFSDFMGIKYVVASEVTRYDEAVVKAKAVINAKN